MPNYTRAICPGGTFFFTLVTYERRCFLTASVARKCLKAAWREVQQKWPFTVVAFCLLPDHLHCVITLPENDGNYSLRWRLIKGRFSRLYRREGMIEEIPQNFSRAKRKELPVWQRRFWEHQIRDEQDFTRHVDYIHFNPVKHGYVERAVDYPWSTFRRFVKDGFYMWDWCVEGDSLRDIARRVE